MGHVHNVSLWREVQRAAERVLEGEVIIALRAPTLANPNGFIMTLYIRPSGGPLTPIWWFERNSVLAGLPRDRKIMMAPNTRRAYRLAVRYLVTKVNIMYRPGLNGLPPLPGLHVRRICVGKENMPPQLNA